ncbi:MAG: aspartate/glutamate racemase family protein [Acidimicrobiia bacterium]
MKRIGLLGGMSWESSVEYERLINQEVRRRLGGTASADLVIRSYNFAEIEALQEASDWTGAGERLAADAVMLERAGAEVIVLCTNTMHKVAPIIEAAISGRFLHIADATADAIRAAGVSSVGLLGTRYTMEQEFYRGRLEAWGIAVSVPGEPDRSMIHRVIFDELVRGEIVEESREAYLAAISTLVFEGAQGVIAGCTEIELLVSPNDVAVPFFPTTAIHAHAAVEASLA